jgi:hypothetical protein
MISWPYHYYEVARTYRSTPSHVTGYTSRRAHGLPYEREISRFIFLKIFLKVFVL